MSLKLAMRFSMCLGFVIGAYCRDCFRACSRACRLMLTSISLLYPCCIYLIVGTYQTNVMATSCITCPANFSTASEGASIVSLCLWYVSVSFSRASVRAYPYAQTHTHTYTRRPRHIGTLVYIDTRGYIDMRSRVGGYSTSVCLCVCGCVCVCGSTQ